MAKGHPNALAVLGVITFMLIARTQAATPTLKDSMGSSAEAAHGLWPVYDQLLKGAKYIDLTHTITPSIPVWKGFAASTFGPALNARTGELFQYATEGFEATHYDLGTDQLGTQLDPPAHWAPGRRTDRQRSGIQPSGF